MDREDTSLHTVYPAIWPALLSTRATSGSGTLISESSRTAIGWPSPATRQAADLKKISGRWAS
jgi:hypothetical protein